MNWKLKDVLESLQSYDSTLYLKHHKLFTEHTINGATLLHLNSGTFEEMGITSKLDESKFNGWLMKLVNIIIYIFYLFCFCL